MSTSAPAAVVIVLRDAAGRVLFVRRAAGRPRAGYWSPPTGRVEPGETAAQAVEREAREELGLEVRALREVWTSTTDDGRYRLHWWLAQACGGELRPAPDEVAELRWVAPPDFPGLAPAFAGHRAFFLDVLPALPD